MNFEQVIKEFFRPKRTQPVEKSVFEQQKEVIDLAEEFDRLTSYPAWTKALTFLAEQVNGTLVEATKHKEDAAKMMWQVVRWDAKRELLDDLQAYVNSARDERDRIVEEIKELEDARRPESESN